MKVSYVLFAILLSTAMTSMGVAQKPVADGADPALARHIAYMVEQLATPNKIIRRSVHQGLVAVGKPALAALEAAAATGKKPRAQLAAYRESALPSH